MINKLKNIGLFVIAWLLIPPLSIINYMVVRRESQDHGEGYFLSSALSLDRWACVEFRASLNKYLITKKGYRFGKIGETISSVLGKNLLTGTLSPMGLKLVWILDKLDKNHAINSIEK
jgi:hypothetical protein